MQFKCSERLVSMAHKNKGGIITFSNAKIPTVSENNGDRMIIYRHACGNFIFNNNIYISAECLMKFCGF